MRAERGHGNAERSFAFYAEARRACRAHRVRRSDSREYKFLPDVRSGGGLGKIARPAPRHLTHPKKKLLQPVRFLAQGGVASRHPVQEH